LEIHTSPFPSFELHSDTVGRVARRRALDGYQKNWSLKKSSSSSSIIFCFG
jgi:hypothetical protein